MQSKIIQQGAEAIIFLSNNKIIKKRIRKLYRHPILDKKLRSLRTKKEAKIMAKLLNIIPVPKIFNTDNKKEIIMEFINGKKLSEYLEKLDYQKICRQIAENITKLHNNNLIHGDLTTSNMIYIKKTKIRNNRKQKLFSINNPQQQSIKDENFKIYFIDFGLSFHSHKIEDKAVDIHLLKQALEAKHYKIAKECIGIILKNYRPFEYKEILKRLKKVELRGRYKKRD